MATLSTGVEADMSFQTMSLASAGGATIASSKRRFAEKVPNRTDDIDGARPRAAARFTRKPDSHNVRDIAGATPRVLHASLKKESHVCRNDDIEGETAAPLPCPPRRAPAAACVLS